MKRMPFYLVCFLLLAAPLICFSSDKSGEVRTKFGVLSVNNENILEFNGKPVVPTVAGNNGLTLLDNFALGESNVVLVRDDGGEACPAMYYFAKIGREAVQMSDRFGSCSDLAKAKLVGGVILVSMPDYSGDVDSRAAVARHLCRYKYENGAIKQLPPMNGRQFCTGD